MEIFEKLAEYRYEQLVFCHDKSTSLRAIIAIHDTTLGPALGGCRMWPYRSEEEAVVDALRLARGMTYKAAASGLNLGGGKSVIIGDSRTDKSEALLRSFGRYIETLGGRYITAEDVGTSLEDMAYIQIETSHVVGVDRASGGSGDPSPFTALGVLQGMKACVEEVFGETSLEGRTVAVQGVGNVGYPLCRMLHEEGASLIVTDVNREAVERAVRDFGAKPVDPEEIFSISCDIFAPCALGAVINDETVPKLRCRIVAGSANNVLLEPRHGEALAERGILYAPDYVINAGGLINVADELEGYSAERARKRVLRIYDSVKSIIRISKRDSVPTHLAADTMALERIEAISSMERLHTGHPYGQLYRRREAL
ncbi:Glu/Leu/Phe/Val dehydrogenase [Rubrobacter taiwanensis]|jgi:leucine dehydrogenase|uniref:Glu/Leu/Phe/Val dehydrogenase n=1 Tax=Rubrobacter taiwanensis TaxID=185139 RepID=A0A4R1BGZ8_9ACTN|nr:Glu/Leu/Phe/Val dehydrogenase dimerization domain-containing protein [Rubrobacter taiwanensis]TCJ16444.1 Glu/Leu/Phe/Val dehydrogenase [Rubrobacter taiwanensis]